MDADAATDRGCEKFLGYTMLAVIRISGSGLRQ